MSANSEASQSSALDSVKWVIVVLLVVSAVAGNALLGDQPLLYRVIGVVILSIVAAVVAATTTKGRAFVSLLQESRAEIRRIVWPTKQETLQTTGIVVVAVAFMALLLWGLDSLLGAIISAIIG